MKLPLHILTPLLLSAALLGSCVSDSDLPTSPSGDGMVNLVLDLGINPGGPSAARASRAMGNDDWFEPAANKFEKVRELRVIILHPSPADPATQVVEVNQVITGSTPLTGSDFFFPNVATTLANLGRFTFHVADQEMKKIYLIANETTLPQDIQANLKAIKEGEPMPFDITASLITVQPQAADLSGGFYIDNADNQSYVPITESYELEVDCARFGSVVENTNGITKSQDASFFITRAATKFTFTASADVAAGSTLAITSITVGGLSTAEYLIPRNTIYSPAKDQAGIAPLGGHEITSFTAPASAKTYSYTFTPTSFAITGETEASADYTKAQATYSPNLYFLESPQTSFPITVTTTVDGTDPVTWTVEKLPNLSLLPRNTHVRVHFTFNAKTQQAEVTVYPYTAVILKPQFGIAPPEADRLTISPTAETEMGKDILLTPSFTSTAGTELDKLIWVASNPSVVLLSPKDNDYDPGDLRYVKPAESIELDYLDADNKPNPVRIIPQKAGTSEVTVYSQTGLVAKCVVTVK